VIIETPVDAHVQDMHQLLLMDSLMVANLAQ
jgi:hypothetical protein